MDAARKEREREEKQRDAANKKQEKQNKQKIQQQNQLLSLQKKFLKIEQRIEGTGFAGSEYDSGKYLNQLYKDFGHYGEGGTFKLDDTADIEKREQALRSLADTIRQLEIELTKYTISQKKDALEAKETKKAVEDKISSFKKMLSAYKSFGRSDIKNKFKELADKIRAADKVTDELQKEFDDLKKECQELDKTVVSLGNDIASQLVSRLKQAATTAVFALFSNAIHMAAENIQLFDNELTQMQIITHESDGAIRDMAEEILSASKRIAASAPDITNAATVFARLGYSGDESVKLAEMATQFSRIADVDIAAAEENLTSIIKAFDININEVESVLDKLVVVGNRFPISAAGIGEGMQNAASALNAAGNTLEESVAMLMAANTTAQDPSRSSTAMRTIAARIRSANGATSEAAITELEELGEDVEGLDQAVLVYQKHLDQYTGGIVQLLDKENGELRSTYDVLNDLAGVWDKLGSQAKAVITKDLAGVRQQDVFSGLMANWDSVNKAISAQADSTGELQKASSIWVDSLQGRLERLKATFQSIAEHLIDNEAIKLTISLLTVVLDIIDRLLSISPELNSALVAFGVSVVGINKVLPTLSTTVKNVADAFNLFTGAAGAAKVEAVGTSGAFSKLVTALGGMPGVIVGVVAAVASAAFAIKAHMDEVHQAVLDNTENASLGYTNIAQAYNAIENASNVGEIVEVLDQIGVKYDDELKSIKDINVARQIGVDLAKQELKLKAAEFVYDNDNEKAYNRSKKVLENDGSFLNATSVVNPFTGGVQYFTGTIDQKILDIESAIEGLEFRYDSLTETEKDYLKNLQETLDPLRTQRDECLVVVDTYEMMKGVLEDVDSALESSSDEYANVSNATNDLTVDVKSAAEAFAEFNDKIDSIQSAYGSLVGAAEQYNKYQALDIDTLQTVLSLEDKYLAALSIQGDQAMVNADIFQTMVDVEMAAAKQKAIDQAYTELLAIAQEQYTESAVEAADETNVLLWELTNLTTGYQNAAYASLTLAQAQSLQEAGIASFSGEKLQKAQQVVAALDARLGLIDRTAETAKSSFKGLNNVMGGYEDAAKDAKSATEKLKQSLEEEVEALEKVGDELDKEANKLKLWGEAMVDALEDRKDALEKEKETLEENLSKEEEYLKLYGDAAGDVINNRINLLNDQKEALEELYEEEDKEYQLMKARQALDEAMANKTVRVYTRDEGWTWQADPTAVKAA